VGPWFLAFVMLGVGSAPADNAPVDRAPDDDCLRWLADNEISFLRAAASKGIHTPVEPRGPIAGLRLVPRGQRRPLMDCELLRALAEAAPVFREHGIYELVFSSAYDYRTRRNTARLSAHGNGLAIDVHGVRGPNAAYDIARDYERGAGRWLDLPPNRDVLAECVGTPDTQAGRTLRGLVCRLKASGVFRVIVTPDDDADHRDHLHLEAFPDVVSRVRRLLGVLPLRSR